MSKDKEDHLMQIIYELGNEVIVLRNFREKWSKKRGLKEIKDWQERIERFQNGEREIIKELEKEIKLGTH